MAPGSPCGDATGGRPRDRADAAAAPAPQPAEVVHDQRLRPAVRSIASMTDSITTENGAPRTAFTR